MQGKSQTQSAGGHKVNLDGFFFSCYEYEKTQKAQNNWPPANRWPSIKFREQRVNLEGKDVISLVEEMIRWYGAEHELVRHNPITVEDLYQFTVLTEFLLQDLGDLYFEKAQEDLHPMSPSDMSQNPFWQAVYSCLRSQFSNSFEYIYRYLTWNYSLPEKVNFNPDSLPPTGHNAPPPKSRISSSGHLIVPERRGGGSFRGNNDRVGRGGGQGGGQGGDRGGRGDGGGRGDRNGNSQNSQGNNRGGPRNDRGDNRGDRNGRGGRGGHRQDAATRERLEVEALKVVVEAIDHLNKQAQVEEVQLPPTNSFLRRMQHSEVATHGYYSHSIGEGENRAVMVTRIKSSASE